MNPNFKDLKVAVVPPETNGINQSSTYEEIVACKKTIYLSVSDYFKTRNNEKLPALHWAFLLDYNKKTIISWSKHDEIDHNQKAVNIKRIKDILTVWGSTSCVERECDHSPSLNSMAGGRVCELVEQFYSDGVETVVYDNDVEVSYDNYKYEELPDEIIDEILEIVEEYEEDMLKTEKRCQD